MPKYKIEILQQDKYIIDVLAETQQEAEKEAFQKFSEYSRNRIKHYYQEGGTEFITGNVYDVTNTEDPFNP